MASVKRPNVCFERLVGLVSSGQCFLDSKLLELEILYDLRLCLELSLCFGDGNIVNRSRTSSLNSITLSTETDASKVAGHGPDRLFFKNGRQSRDINIVETGFHRDSKEASDFCALRIQTNSRNFAVIRRIQDN